MTFAITNDLRGNGTVSAKTVTASGNKVPSTGLINKRPNIAPDKTLQDEHHNIMLSDSFGVEIRSMTRTTISEGTFGGKS
jgi:hypothetical protein